MKNQIASLRMLCVLGLLFAAPNYGLADCLVKAVSGSTTAAAPTPYRIVDNGRDLGLRFESFDAAVHHFRKYLQEACPRGNQPICPIVSGKVQWRTPAEVAAETQEGVAASIVHSASGWHIKQGDQIISQFVDRKNAEEGQFYLEDSGYCQPR